MADADPDLVADRCGLGVAGMEADLPSLGDDAASLRAGLVALTALSGLVDALAGRDERLLEAFLETFLEALAPVALPTDETVFADFADFIGFTAAARGRWAALVLAGAGFFFDFATVNRFSFPRKDLALCPRDRPSDRLFGQKTGQNNGRSSWGQSA